MPTANPKAAADVSGRRKATMACECCRKRRARCSALPPEQSPIRDELSEKAASEASSSPVMTPPSPNIPPLHQWRQSIEICIGAEPSVTSEQSEARMETICHLIELFWTHVDVQQTSCLCKEDFFNKLESKNCPDYLCFAMLAVSAKYLNHKAAKALLGPGQETGFAYKARTRLMAIDEEDLLSRGQALCVLALYEMHRGNGVQAWADLSLAESLIQLLQSQQQSSPETCRSKHMVGDFLRITKMYHLLGNHGLSSHALICGVDNRGPDRTQLFQLLQLAVRVQEFERSSSVEALPYHWHSESEFRRLQSALDQYLLQQPGEFCVTREILRGWLAQGSLEPVHCTLVWHYCTILLNRIFLPIRRRRPHADDGSPDVIHYPAAPKHFLVERKNVCEAAASTISTICNEVMRVGYFFPTPLIGYACYQSSLVLLDRLHAGTTQEWNDAMEHLQINFAILGAMKKYYLPTESWINTLLNTQQSRAAPPELDGDHLFRDYFSRFEGLMEPALVPLSVIKPATEFRSEASSPGHADETVATSAAEPACDRLQQPAWLDEYQNRLGEQMAAYYDTNADSLHSLAASERSHIIQHSSPDSLVSHPPPGVASNSPARGHLLKGDGSVGMRPAERNGESDADRPPLGKDVLQKTGLANGHSASNLPLARFNMAPNEGPPLPVPDMAGVDNNLQSLPNMDEGPQSTGWIQPHVPSFSNQADIESILFDHLESGQTWMDTHMAGQRPTWMDQWVEELHLDVA
ncbi:hypothetical protein ABEF91_002801 [Exophiala dermatitidis]